MNHVQPAPGWYPDPSGQGGLRYWNGAHWTNDVRSVSPCGPAPATPADGGAWVGPTAAVAASVVSVLLILGFTLLVFETASSGRGDATRTSASTVIPTTTSDASVGTSSTVTAWLTAASSPTGTSTAGAVEAMTATVPWVVGSSQAAAQNALAAAGLVVQVTTDRQVSGVHGAVLSQSPAADTVVELGSTVQIVVAEVVAVPVAPDPGPVPKSAPAPKPPTSPKPAPAPAPQKCTPGYDPCLPPASDYDCAGGSGNGPKYVDGPVRVTGSDPYGLDRDGDGIGCE